MADNIDRLRVERVHPLKKMKWQAETASMNDKCGMSNADCKAMQFEMDEKPIRDAHRFYIGP